MKIDWNVFEVERQIQRMRYAINDPYLTGFNTWPVKQDLYRLKWLIDDALANCPTFADEEKFIDEHEKEITWKALNEVRNM
jgi:hypothetical protein